MNSKSHNSIVNQAPDWWQHSIQAWIELYDFFSDETLANPANWQKLTKGLSNHNYKLTLTHNNEKPFYFVQVINLDNIALLPQCDDKQEVQSMFSYLASKPSLQPWLVNCHLYTSSIRVFDWVESEPLTINQFDPDGILSTAITQPYLAPNSLLFSVCNFMTKLHDIKMPSTGRAQLVRINIQQHLRGYHQLAFERAPDHSKDINQLLRQSLPITKDFNPSKLCHNDLSLNNLLWNNENASLKVIDWEYACYSDPIMDLAGFLLNFQLAGQQQQIFVDLYSDKTGTDISSDKLNSMKQLCQNISTLWQFCSF